MPDPDNGAAAVAKDDLIERLKKRAASLRVASVTCEGAHYEDVAQYGVQTLAFAEDLDEAATALAARDAELARRTEEWSNLLRVATQQRSIAEAETKRATAARDARIAELLADTKIRIDQMERLLNSLAPIERFGGLGLMLETWIKKDRAALNPEGR